MARWILKAAIQRAIALLPGRSSVNYLFQKHVTHTVLLRPDWFEAKVRGAASHVADFAARTGRDHPDECMELGTGWHPIVPLCLVLCGARRVRTVDLHSLLREERVAETVSWILRYEQEGRLRELLPAALPDRLEALRTAADAHPGALVSVLRDLGVHTLVLDARNLPVDPASIDLIVSDNTFEHIPGPILEGIVREMRRVIRPDGVMSHFIDMSDHYSHFDPSISNWNFLRYSDRAWRVLDSPIVPQNRLRISDFRSMLGNAGFRIVEERQIHVRTELPEGTQLAPRFAAYATEDLLVTHCTVVAVPAT